MTGPVVHDRWPMVHLEVVPPRSAVSRVVAYFTDGGSARLALGAAALLALLVPWPDVGVVAIVTVTGGSLLRWLQLRRARRPLGPGPFVTCRASPAELRRLPFDRLPLLDATRECIVEPRATHVDISAVADGRRRLTCRLDPGDWSVRLQVDGRGRAQRISVAHHGEPVLDGPALGTLPMDRSL